MSENLDNDQLNRLWEHGLHIDAMFHNRLNFFLVFESILLGVVGLLYSRSTTAKPVLISIICLGLILTILWGYVQARMKYVFDSLRTFHREVIPEYKLTLIRRERVKWPISSTSLETYGVPLLVALIWIVLFIFTITT
jgi:hypothetical protein